MKSSSFWKFLNQPSSFTLKHSPLHSTLSSILRSCYPGASRSRSPDRKQRSTIPIPVPVKSLPLSCAAFTPLSPFQRSLFDLSHNPKKCDGCLSADSVSASPAPCGLVGWRRRGICILFQLQLGKNYQGGKETSGFSTSRTL